MIGLDHEGHPRRSCWAPIYAAAAILGVLYLAGPAQAIALAGAADSATAYAFQWSLLVGGLVGLAGNLAPRHHYRWALVIELAGAVTVVLMATVYIFSISAGPVNRPPYATITWMTGLSVALAGRAVETMQQRRRALDFAEARRALETED